jgi:tagatose 6-phosphate kinase
MILCVGATPAVQRVMVFPQLHLDAVNRAAMTLDGACGKAVNAAKVLKVLGENPLVTGFLGGDRGDYLRSILRDKGIETDFVEVTPRTRQCVTLIDEAAQTQTELVEESQAVEPAAYTRLLDVIRKHAPQCRAMMMLGTLTPGGPVDFYAQCVRIARETGIPSLVDAQGPVLLEALKAQPAIVKPNRKELAATLGRLLSNEAEVLAAMRELIESGAQRVVVTSGKEPTLATDGQSVWRILPSRIKVVNPIGSGDAFAAGLIARLAQGADLGEACRWGGAAAAANALTLMPGETRREDAERLALQIKTS